MQSMYYFIRRLCIYYYFGLMREVRHQQGRSNYIYRFTYTPMYI